MISTVTLNPSIDYMIQVENLQLDAVNRCKNEAMFPGGKGINVSIVLNNLGIKSQALGFVAGFTGHEITRLVESKGVCADFITLEEGQSRINVKIKSNEETEINGNGPHISEAHIKTLYDQIHTLQQGDVLVLAGSIPNTVPASIYKDIMISLKDKGIEIVVDATKELLMNVLPMGPFLIKPNHHELGELFGVKITTQDEVVVYAKKLQELGARNVLISMAGDGAILVTEDGCEMRHGGLRGTVKNSVGAGDSMVAGFVAGYTLHKDYKEAFKMGIATGSASAFSEDLATKEEVEALLAKIVIG
ncbi:MAG: 1-phosphofructokinase [Cellulosilyticaceae bacterium]